MKKILEIISALWFPLLILLFLIILSISVVYGQDTEINDAKRLVEREQFDKASAVLKKAQATYPDATELWYFLGTTQLESGDPALGRQSYEKGISLNEKEALNYAGRGKTFLLAGDIEKAEVDFNKALSLSRSKNVSVLNAVAEGYLAKDKLTDKALTILLKARDLDDRSTETLVLLGHAYLKKNDGGKAVTSYENAAALNPASAKPHYAIGLVYLRSRNYDAAEIAFTKALQVDPAYTLAYKELGELSYQKKDGEQAVRHYKKYLELTERPRDGQLRYAFFLFMAKDFQQANQVFSSIISAGNVTPTTKRYYAYSLYEAGEFEKSAAAFKTYFEEYGEKNIEALDYNYYGKLLLKENNDSLAIKTFEKSLSVEKNQPEIVQLYGETLLKAKKYEEASTAFETLSTMKKLSSQDLYAQGRAYYFNNQYEKADTVFQKLIILQPNMTVGYIWAGRTKSNLDPESENGLAKPYYEAAIEKAASSPEKNKQELKEAYSYLGYFYFLKNDRAVCKTYWEKVLQLDPNDNKAKEALKALHSSK
jgi:tetratricopeptide (TPR) repeat protein